MEFCSNCGTQADNMKFCPSCGHAIIKSTQQAQGSEQQAYTPSAAPVMPQQVETHSAQDDKTMALLAYLLFFIPLLTGAHKTSDFVKYHTNQGTVLFIAMAVYGISYSILTTILRLIPLIGRLLSALLGLGSLVGVIFCIIGILNAVNNRKKPLPLIGGIEIIK
jgi:uncharacterized membrane protein